MSTSIRRFRLAIVAALLVGQTTAARAAETLSGPFAAAVEEVVDGDTLRARVSIWLGQELSVLVRIRGIDAPEMRGRCDREKEEALSATAALRRLVAQEAVVLTQVEGDKYFGRVVADVATVDGADIGAALIAGGHARAYDGGARRSWCEVGMVDDARRGNRSPDGAERNPG